MNPLVRLAWYFGGLSFVVGGSVVLWGWPAAFIVVGLWAMIATAVDAIMEQNSL